MKKIFMAIVLMLPVTSKAACVGKFAAYDEWVPAPSILRDVADGRWQAGGSSDVWGLYCGDAKLKALDAGYYGTWDLDHGASSYGVHAGVGMAYLTDRVHSLIGLPDPLALLAQYSNKWSLLKYANSFLSLDGWAGYRPHMNGDLTHRYPYGFMVRLNVKWTQKQTMDAVNGGL